VVLGHDGGAGPGRGREAGGGRPARSQTARRPEPRAPVFPGMALPERARKPGFLEAGDRGRAALAALGLREQGRGGEGELTSRGEQRTSWVLAGKARQGRGKRVGGGAGGWPRLDA